MLYGWMPNEPDDRDWVWVPNRKAAFGAPSSVDLSVALPYRPLLQGAIPSCVAHAIANQIHVVERVLPVRDSVPSRAFIYYAARRQHQTELALTGTYPRFAYKAIQKLGCPPEEAWPYETDRLNKAPGAEALRFAQSRYGLKYYSLIGPNRSGLVRAALADGRPVCFGTQIFEAFRVAKSNTIIKAPPQGEPLLGGHYMCIVGYFGDNFILANSWRGQERLLAHESLLEWAWSSDFTVADGWDGMNIG
jgi:hypothetical protein